MASYHPNLPDYIPTLQSFNPDLNYYSNILSVKQAQYDDGLRKLNSIYGSVLNSPMLREDNIRRREEYFRTIDEDLKKIARMDLSMDQNVATAEKIFDPILNDKYMVKDMGYTRGLRKAFQIAEQYRHCVDPDKCGGEYWDAGMMALNYAAEEFQNASAEDSMRLTAPSFVPYQNVHKKAIKAAKDAGFDVSYDYTSNGYIVTDKNGQLLLGEKGDGVLPQFLYGIFGNDPKVQAMYSTQAYVQRKNFAKEYAAKYGSEEGAESAYLNEIVSKVIPKLDHAKKDLQDQRDRIMTNLKALELLKDQKGTAKGDGTESAQKQLMKLVELTNESEKYHDNVENLLTSAPGINDLRTMRNRADNIVANGLFMNEIQRAAVEYAMGTAKRDIKADPYALATFRDNLSYNRAVRLKELDHKIWTEQQRQLGKLGSKQDDFLAKVAEQLQKKGVTWKELHKMGINEKNITTKSSLDKLTKSGLLDDPEIQTGTPFASIPADAVAATYHDNNRVVLEGVDNSVDKTAAYMESYVKNLQQSYQAAAANPNDEASQTIQTKILSDAKAVFEGTGIDYKDVVTGKVPLERLAAMSQLDKAAQNAAFFQQKDTSARVYNQGWDDTELMEMQIANQAAKGLMQEKENMQKSAIDNLKAGATVGYREGQLDRAQMIKQNVLIESLFDKEGNILPTDDSFLRYGNALKQQYYQEAKQVLEMDARVKKGLRPAGRTYQQQSSYSQPEISHKDIVNKAVQMAKADYMANKPQLLKGYSSRLRSLTARSGFAEDGDRLGMGSGRTAIFNFDGDQPLEGEYRNVRTIFNEVKNSGVPYKILSPPPGSVPGEIPSLNVYPAGDPVFANTVMDMVINGDAKNANIRTELQHFPNDNSVAVKVEVDEKTARKLRNIKKELSVTPEQRSFVIQTTGELPFLKSIVDRMNPSSADILLRTPGKSISLNLPNKGSATIRNKNGSLVIDPIVRDFNPSTGEWKTIALSSVELGVVSTKSAFKVAKSLLEQSKVVNDLEYERYQNNQSNGKTGR